MISILFNRILSCLSLLGFVLLFFAVTLHIMLYLEQILQYVRCRVQDHFPSLPSTHNCMRHDVSEDRSRTWNHRTNPRREESQIALVASGSVKNWGTGRKTEDSTGAHCWAWGAEARSGKAEWCSTSLGPDTKGPHLSLPSGWAAGTGLPWDPKAKFPKPSSLPFFILHWEFFTARMFLVDKGEKPQILNAEWEYRGKQK